jgi:hypothetical protein
VISWAGARAHDSRAHECQEINMFEIAMIGIGLGLFAAAALYILACERL